MEEFLASALKAAAPVAVAVILFGYGPKAAKYSHRPGILRYGWLLRIIALVSFTLLGVAIAVLIAGAYDADEPGETAAFFTLIVILGAATTYLGAEAHLVQGSFDEHRIEFRTPWTGAKVEKWDDLVGVDYLERAQIYVLRFNTGTVIRASALLGGVGHLVGRLKSLGYDL